MTSSTSEKPAAPAANLLRSRVPELDAIRGIAVLLVLFVHGFGFRCGLNGLSGIPKLFVASTPPGWMGVNLFFVPSGFLIAGILLGTKSKANYDSLFPGVPDSYAAESDFFFPSSAGRRSFRSASSENGF